MSNWFLQKTQRKLTRMLCIPVFFSLFLQGMLHFLWNTLQDTHQQHYLFDLENQYAWFTCLVWLWHTHHLYHVNKVCQMYKLCNTVIALFSSEPIFIKFQKRTFSSIRKFVIWRLVGCKFATRGLSLQCLSALEGVDRLFGSKYCKHGYFCWGKISRKYWQDLSRGGHFCDTSLISLIKSYGFKLLFSHGGNFRDEENTV